jgi:ATP-dependent RNA helicase DDX46/PRP5
MEKKKLSDPHTNFYRKTDRKIDALGERDHKSDKEIKREKEREREKREREREKKREREKRQHPINLQLAPTIN